MAKTKDQIQKEIEETRERMSETIDTLVEKGDVKSRAQDTLEDARETATGYIEDARETATGYIEDARETATGYTKRHPTEAAIMSLTLVLLVLVYLWYRRR